MTMAFYFGFQHDHGIRFSQLWLAYGAVPDVDPAVLLEATNKAQSY